MTPEDVLSDPAASFWLKKAIRDLQKRDPVDALNDTEFLLSLLKWEAKRERPDAYNWAKEQERLSEEDYVKAKGAHCPYCNSTDLRPSADTEFTIDSLFQEVLCLSCRKEWTDQYKLVGYSPIS